MNAPRQRIIRAEARKLLVRLWERRKEFWSTPPSVEDFVRQAPEIIITQILEFALVKPEEIPQDSALSHSAGMQIEIAGYIDRPNRRIVVAQKFQLVWRRF